MAAIKRATGFYDFVFQLLAAPFAFATLMVAPPTAYFFQIPSYVIGKSAWFSYSSPFVHGFGSKLVDYSWH